MNLTLQQLRAFREVMRYGSISKAADSLNRTQPTISTMISNLESELGFTLFERKKGRIIATPEASYFLEESAFLLDRLNQSVRTMRQIGDMNKGTLKIACLPVASDFLLPREIVKFTKDRPDVSISLIMRSSSIVDELVASQQVDIGFSETTKSRDSLNICSYQYNCVCAVHINNPLASKKVITPQDLDNIPLAALSKDHLMYREIKRVFEAADVNMYHRFDLQTVLPALELVENNVCCAILDMVSVTSYKIYRRQNPQIIFKPFVPSIPFSISILTPKQRPQSILAKAFYQQLTETFDALKM